MMHMNTIGLISVGFKMVAKYVCFSKGEKAFYIECYKKENENETIYLVRQFNSGGHAWDNVYNDKEKANDRVIYLRSLYKCYKKY